MPISRFPRLVRTAHTRRWSWLRFAYCDRSVPAELEEWLWREPERLVEFGELMRLNRMRRTVHLRWGSRDYVVKHYFEPTRRHALKRTVQQSRAQLTWAAMHRLADLGIATPRPVAYVENRWSVFRGNSFLMYPYIDGRTLGSYLRNDEATAASKLDALCRQFAELWKRLKKIYVSLADPDPSNFIIAPEGRLWLIDLDKTRFHRWAWLAEWHDRRAWDQLIRSTASVVFRKYGN
jgi:tRNA A-37 threonylcarbamoyl transferase component Bud32